MTSEFDEDYLPYTGPRRALPALPAPRARQAPMVPPAAVRGPAAGGEIQMMPIVSIPLVLLLDLVNMGQCPRDCAALLCGTDPGTIQQWADRRAADVARMREVGDGE